MEVIEELALRIPATLICELMGVPTADQARSPGGPRGQPICSPRRSATPNLEARAKRVPRSPTTSDRSTQSAAPRRRTTS